MIVLITSTGPDLQSPVDPRFGRGAYFIVVDTGTMRWLAQPNAGVNAAGGGGTLAAQFAADQGAQVAISGEFGPNAHAALVAAGIKMYLLGQSKTVWDALSSFIDGKLEQLDSPSATGQHRGRGF